MENENDHGSEHNIPRESSPPTHEAHVNNENLVSKFRENPWILSTLVLGVLVLIFLVANFGGATGFTITGGAIGVDDASESIVGFLNKQTGGGVEYVSTEDFGNLYEVMVSYEEREIPVYVTKDGEYYVQGIVPLNEELDSPSTPAPEATEAPKSDKPEVELFIWSYCPYGVLAQGPLAEVASLLKGTADFKAIMYYAGHGPYEEQQNKIQACIQKNAQDKYWDYAAGFVKDIEPNCGQSRDIDCDKTESIKLMDSLGIDSSSIMSCVDSEGADLIAADSAQAKSLGVTGSPTLMINGVKINAARNSEAYKQAVCSAFNTAPGACDEALSATTAAASGSC